MRDSRLSIYVQNIGRTAAFLNFGLLLYVFVIQIRLALTSQADLVLALSMTFPVVALGLFGPLLLLRTLVRHVSVVLRIYRILAWLNAGVILLLLTGVMGLNYFGFLGITAVVFSCHGVIFWTLSDNRVFTGRRYERVQAFISDREGDIERGAQ